MRKILMVPAIFLSALLSSTMAVGQSFPSKAVRIIVGSSPGGGTDLTARLIAQPMGEILKQSFFVENRSQGTVYGLEMTSRAEPDGHTISVTAASGYIAAVLATKLPFNVKTDIIAVAQLTSQPYLVVVHPSVKVNSFSELLAMARSKPGSLNYASSGYGSTAHVGMELLKLMAEIDLVHIPYKGGGPALSDTIAGITQTFLASPISGMQFVKSKKLYALAVTSANRSGSLPGYPTVSESGVPGFELVSWYGIVAPKGVSPQNVQTLFQAINRVLARSDIQEKIKADGADIPVSTSPNDFAKVISREIDMWEQFGAKTNIRLD